MAPCRLMVGLRRQRVRLDGYSRCMAHYFAFVALVAVLVLIPGPAVILVMQKAMTIGYPGALRVAVGVLSAGLVWAAAVAAGVSAVIVASEPAFLTLRLAGAAYLIYLGVRLLLARRLLHGSGGVLVGFGVALAAER